jgi:hypothetical protein
MSDPCPPGQRNDLFVIAPGKPGDLGRRGAPSIDFSPPCGCYETMGMNILDFIGIGWIFKGLGIFGKAIKYVLMNKKIASSSWTRCVVLMGGRLHDFVEESASLLAQSKDEVLNYFGTIMQPIEEMVNRHILDVNGNIGTKTSGFFNIPFTFTNTVDDITFTEIGSLSRKPGAADIIGGTAPKYNTTRIKSNIDAITSQVDLAVAEALAHKRDLVRAENILTKALRGEGTAFIRPGPKNIASGMTLTHPDFPRAIRMDFDIDVYLSNYDMSVFNKLQITPHFTGAKEVRIDKQWILDNIYKEGQPGGLHAKLLSDLEAKGIDPIFADVDAFGDMITDTGGAISSTISEYILKSRSASQDITNRGARIAITEGKGAHARLIFAKEDYINDMDLLQQTVGKNKDVLDKDLLSEATEEANKSLRNPSKHPQVDWGIAAFFFITGRVFLSEFGRQKVCLGDAIGGFWGSEDGARLNPETCNCECPNTTHTECTADHTLNPVWGTIAWTWDNFIPVTPKTSEMVTCYETCCDSQTAWKSTLTQRCGCSCFGDIPSWAVPLGSGSSESHFKASEGCPCTKPGWFLGFGTTTGACVTDTQTTTALGQGQAWDEAKCEYNCAETRALPLKLGASPDCPDTRLTTNMSGSSYSAFKPGSVCECECSQAASGAGSWPPTCPAGYVFDTRANVCGCMPAGVCKEYAMTGSGETFTGPNKLADAIAAINSQCTGVGTYGYYYTDEYGDIVAEVATRDLTDNGEGPIGYDTITGYSAVGNCSDTLGPEFTVICGSVQGGHNYTWTACPTDGSSCPLTLSDEAFNYSYP